VKTDATDKGFKGEEYAILIYFICYFIAEMIELTLSPGTYFLDLWYTTLPASGSALCLRCCSLQCRPVLTS
jgi:hypothetical protein